MSADLKLAEMISELAIEARVAVQDDIPRFLAAREISSLFHFTSIKNLESIAANGFMGRESLNNMNLNFTQSDQIRYEPILDGVCFSLSRPNYYMAARKIISGHEMVLLELQGLNELLTKYNFVASPGNFGSPFLKRKIESWPEEFIGGQGLMNLFKNPDIRKKYNIPDFEPTDPQAEIILLDGIPWHFVKKIYFPNSAGYSVEEELRKIVRELPVGAVLHSQVREVFPDINWKDKQVVAEYHDRRWNEMWTD
jgi:hypothetical protein